MVATQDYPIPFLLKIRGSIAKFFLTLQLRTGRGPTERNQRLLIPSPFRWSYCQSIKPVWNIARMKIGSQPASCLWNVVNPKFSSSPLASHEMYSKSPKYVNQLFWRSRSTFSLTGHIPKDRRRSTTLKIFRLAAMLRSLAILNAKASWSGFQWIPSVFFEGKMSSSRSRGGGAVVDRLLRQFISMMRATSSVWSPQVRGRWWH